MILERLADALEAVVRECPTLPVVAIRWMYVKHPLHEVQRRLLHEHGEQRGGLRLLRRLLQSAACAVFLSCRLLGLRLLLRRPMAAMTRERFDLIAKTCCFWSGQSIQGSGFLFRGSSAANGFAGSSDAAALWECREGELAGVCESASDKRRASPVSGVGPRASIGAMVRVGPAACRMASVAADGAAVP